MSSTAQQQVIALGIVVGLCWLALAASYLGEAIRAVRVFMRWTLGPIRPLRLRFRYERSAAWDSRVHPAQTTLKGSASHCSARPFASPAAKSFRGGVATWHE